MQLTKVEQMSGAKYLLWLELSTASILIRDLNVSVRYASLFTVLDSRITSDGVSGYTTAFAVIHTTLRTILRIFVVYVHFYIYS